MRWQVFFNTKDTKDTKGKTYKSLLFRRVKHFLSCEAFPLCPLCPLW